MSLNVQVVPRNKGVFGRLMTERTSRLKEAEQRARAVAATIATDTTQASFEYKRKGTVPRRAGRTSTGRKLKTKLRWMPSDTGVAFDLDYADSAAYHWFIQEVGTGAGATMKTGGGTNPRGRPAKGSNYARTVRSQRGRPISSAFIFSSGQRFSPAGATFGPRTLRAGKQRNDQQLYLRSSIAGAPPATGVEFAIRREIEGQHMVKKGSEAGFQQYRTDVLLAARRAFAGQPFRP